MLSAQKAAHAPDPSFKAKTIQEVIKAHGNAVTQDAQLDSLRPDIRHHVGITTGSRHVVNSLLCFRAEETITQFLCRLNGQTEPLHNPLHVTEITAQNKTEFVWLLFLPGTEKYSFKRAAMKTTHQYWCI